MKHRKLRHTPIDQRTTPEKTIHAAWNVFLLTDDYLHQKAQNFAHDTRHMTMRLGVGNSITKSKKRLALTVLATSFAANTATVALTAETTEQATAVITINTFFSLAIGAYTAFKKDARQTLKKIIDFSDDPISQKLVSDIKSCIRVGLAYLAVSNLFTWPQSIGDIFLNITSAFVAASMSLSLYLTEPGNGILKKAQSFFASVREAGDKLTRL